MEKGTCQNSEVSFFLEITSLADGDNNVDTLRGVFGEASVHLTAAGSGEGDDAKISMKWDKNPAA